MYIPGTEIAAAASGPLLDVEGTPLGVATEILPEFTPAEAPVPGTATETDGSVAALTGSGSGMDAIGSSTLPDGMVPDGSNWADAPAADARRPAAEAVTVALLGVVASEVPPTRA
jgi:hypothetical protein